MMLENGGVRTPPHPTHTTPHHNFTISQFSNLPIYNFHNFPIFNNGISSEPSRAVPSSSELLGTDRDGSGTAWELFGTARSCSGRLGSVPSSSELLGTARGRLGNCLGRLGTARDGSGRLGTNSIVENWEIVKIVNR